MKVLLTTDNIGGVWTYSLELAGALMQRGVQVALATMGQPLSSAQQQELQDNHFFNIFESSYKLEWMDDPWEDVDEAGRWLTRCEREFGPDIVHLNGYSHATLPWRNPVIIVGHSCVLSWWNRVKRENAPPSWNEYRRRVTMGLRAARMTIAPTRDMMQFLNRFYGPLVDTAVIPNGRNQNLFSPQRKEPFIFSAGRLWDQAKNLNALESVAPYVSWPIYVAGDVQHPCGGRSNPFYVRLMGKFTQSQMSDWLGRASIYALPARYEPFGLSVLEAALSGCALVLGDIPSLREVWEDCALYVPPDDTRALRSTLRMLIADDVSRRIYSDRAFLRARQYSVERMAEDYINVYEQCLGVKHSCHVPVV